MTTAYTTRRATPRHQAPGTLVDVGGHHLHLYSMGGAPSQGPTVVLEAGLAEGALSWGLVQPAVSTFARVAAYDRAGYGWSDPAPQPRSPVQMVTELHTLLTTTHLPGPYILVGHSLGGLLMRLFASQYPQQVAGLVLLDAVSDRLFLRSPLAYRDWARGLRRTFSALMWVARFGILHLLIWLRQTQMFPTLVTKQPQARQALLLEGGFLSGKNFQAALAELPLFANSTQEIDRALPLGALPLVVLTHGQPSLFSGLSVSQAQEAEEVWQQVQRETAALSSQGHLRVAERSGHDIHIDQPDLVIEAIRQVVARS